MDKAGLAEVERRVQGAFNQLDEEIDPTYKYVAKEKVQTDSVYGFIKIGSTLNCRVWNLFFSLAK